MTVFTKQSKPVDKAAKRAGTDIFGHDVAVDDEVQFQWNYLDGKKQAVSILCTDCVLEEIQFPTLAELNAGQPATADKPASKQAASKQASLGTVTQLELIETMKAFSERIMEAFDKRIKLELAALPELPSTFKIGLDLVAEGSLAKAYGITSIIQPVDEIDPSLESNCTAVTGKGAQCVNPATKGDRCGRHADKPASQPATARQLTPAQMVEQATLSI
jgi:hypothetical protein